MGLLVVTKRPFSIEGPHCSRLSDASFSPRSPVPRRLRASPTCQAARPMPAPARASSRLSAFRPWAAREARSAAQTSRRSCSTECRRGPWCCGTWRPFSRGGREDGEKLSYTRTLAIVVITCSGAGILSQFGSSVLDVNPVLQVRIGASCFQFQKREGKGDARCSLAPRVAWNWCPGDAKDPPARTQTKVAADSDSGNVVCF
ncbi:hypothetical protein GQ55_9G580500 [Panicum hallii var. hallii]|uniref:Uncharacterized protein n=1 Tax=Panicum hallii var. hallii TaxID=1504633 RepID=A0A2T7CGF4_9POAL|nr:hypothetical protein GQ55_9G580500 [Panicum hallii var. hallii]